MSRMGALLLLLTAAIGLDPDTAAAYADRAKLAPADQGHVYYLTLANQRSPEAKERLAKVVRSTVPSLSSRTYLGDQLPVRVSDNLLRLDIRGLGWSGTFAVALQKFYPYRPDLKHTHFAPLVSRADFFCACFTDPIVTGDSQYRLLYGHKPPTTTKEFRAFWKANEDPQFLFQFHEAGSGVGVNPDRNVQQFDTATRGGLYATQDSENPAGDKDPGNYGKQLKFDAGEEIALAPKQYNGEQSVALVWWLGDGKGQRQFTAPARIVTDKHAVRSTEIRNDISCRVCHVEGLRPLNVNGFKEFIESGARVAADKHTQRLIDQQYQSGMAQQIEADNKLFAKYLDLTSGYTTAQYAKAFEAVVRAYDAPVTRQQAAHELYMTEDEFKQALGYYSAKYSLPRRLASLAEGVPMSRGQWVDSFAVAWDAREKWGSK